MKSFLTRIKLHAVLWIRHFLNTPTAEQVSAVMAGQLFEEQEMRRREIRNALEVVSRLADEVRKIQGTVSMLALWQAKHDVELLERRDRGTHEAHTC